MPPGVLCFRRNYPWSTCGALLFAQSFPKIRFVREKVTVLIVEDNAGVRRLLRRTVAETATNVWECSDGADALAAYSAHRPDIVLMDVRMPRIDGFTATRQILEFDPLARIVMITQYDDEGIRGAAREAGACGYVLKLNLLDLNHLIQTITERPKGMPNAGCFGPR